MIRKYDINDYKYKTELTRERLYTAVHTALATYRDLVALDANRRGLEKVIEASAQIFEMRSLERFAQGVLEQLAALLYLDSDLVMLKSQRPQPSGVVAKAQTGALAVLAATGRYADAVGKPAPDALPADVLLRIDEALRNGEILQGEGYTVLRPRHSDLVFYVDAPMPPEGSDDRRLIEAFFRNVALAHENLLHLQEARRGPSR